MHPNLIFSFGGPVLHGESLPAHLGRSFGRHVFRLLHVEGYTRRGLWLRDLPLNLESLAAFHGFPHALVAYHVECERAHVPLASRPVATPTLSQFATVYPHPIQPHNNGLHWTPAVMPGTPLYRLAWNLRDFRVASVQGGSIWFTH